MQMRRIFMKTFTFTHPASNEIGERVESGLRKFSVNKVKLKSEKVKHQGIFYHKRLGGIVAMKY